MKTEETFEYTCGRYFRFWKNFKNVWSTEDVIKMEIRWQDRRISYDKISTKFTIFFTTGPSIKIFNKNVQKNVYFSVGLKLSGGSV